MHAGDEFDERGFTGAVVAENASDLAASDSETYVGQRSYVAVVLGDVAQLDDDGFASSLIHAGCRSTCRRTNMLTRVASSSIAPKKNLNQSGFQPAYTTPWLTTPKINAPKAAPTMEPYPPVNRQPPTTAATMYSSSSPTPPPDCTVLYSNSWCMPATHAHRPTAMNRPTLVDLVGTPTARALAALPPAANIQLPTLVRSRTHVPSATSASHQRMLTLISAPAKVNDEAKIAWAESKPGKLETSLVATLPVTSRVIAKFAP